MSLTPILGFIKRRGERVWFRNVSRYTDYATGDPKEAYLDNQSVYVRITERIITDDGQSILLPTGKAIAFGQPIDFFNASITVQTNDLIIRLPDNYSASQATIWRISSIERQPLLNQSNYYIRLDLELTAARE